MTIEANLASIAKSLETIAAAMSQRPISVQQVVKAEIVAAPIAEQPVPNVTPVVAPVVTVQPTPVAVAPVAAASPSNVFADHNSFVAFVMEAYKALGPIKGAKIQEVLTAVGVKNINDVKPEMYAQIKAGVEALAV